MEEGVRAHLHGDRNPFANSPPLSEGHTAVWFPSGLLWPLLGLGNPHRIWYILSLLEAATQCQRQAGGGGGQASPFLSVDGALGGWDSVTHFSEASRSLTMPNTTPSSRCLQLVCKCLTPVFPHAVSFGQERFPEGQRPVGRVAKVTRAEHLAPAGLGLWWA